MENGTDPNLTLRINGDASGGVSAAQQQTDALQQTTTAAQETASATREMGEADNAAAEQAERLNKLMQEHRETLMRNAFYVHRLAEGFKDIGQGGRVASQGVMDISESLQYMLGPEYAIYAAMAQVVAMMAMMATMHHRRAGEAKEASDAEKEAAEQVTQAWTSANEILKAQLKSIDDGKFWAKQYEAAKQVTDEMGRQAEAVHGIEGAQAALMKARQENALAELNLQEQLDIAKANGDEKQEARIKQRYDGLRKIAEAENEEARRQAELDNLKKDRGTLVAEGQSIQQQMAGAQSDLARQVDDVRKQLRFFDTQDSDNTGFGKSDYEVARDRQEKLNQQQKDHAAGLADDDGKMIPGLSVADQIELDQLNGGGVSDQKKLQDQAGHRLFDQQYDKAKEEREKLEKASSLVSDGDTIKGMNAEETAAQVRTWTDRAKALADYMKQVDTYRNLLKQMDDAEKAYNKAQADGQKALEENKAKIGVADTNIQAAQENVGTADIHKDTAVQTSINQGNDSNVREFQKQNELDGKAVDKANRDAARKKKDEDSEHLKDLHNQIQNVLGRGEASGNKEVIAAMRKIVEVFRGKTDSASQALELSQLMTVHITQQDAVNAETARQIRQLHTKIDRNSSTSK